MSILILKREDLITESQELEKEYIDGIAKKIDYTDFRIYKKQAFAGLESVDTAIYLSDKVACVIKNRYQKSVYDILINLNKG